MSILVSIVMSLLIFNYAVYTAVLRSSIISTQYTIRAILLAQGKVSPYGSNLPGMDTAAVRKIDFCFFPILTITNR